MEISLRAELSVILGCAALFHLALSEWLMWGRAETTPVTANNMGTGLFAGLWGLLVLQLVALMVFGVLARGWSLLSGPGRLLSASELGIVVAITGIAVVLRCAALQEIPFGLWFDTAENGNQALRMLRDPTYRPVFIAEATQLPAFFTYLDAVSINWFGPEALAVRLPSAILGAATVPALWWLGRQLGGPALGVTAAFALATSRWHIDFSRLAIASIATPLALTLALAATVAAIRATDMRQRIWLSILAGLSVSLGLWSYPASVLIVPAVVAGVAWWVARGGPSQVRLRLPQGALVLAIALASCVLALGPLIGVAVRDPDTVLQRSQTVAVSGANAGQEVFESAIQHVLMFTVRGDRNGRHNTPGRPELGWFAPFFLAGIGAALWRPGAAVSLAIPGALLLLASGILTLPFEAPQSHRAILSVVPASLLVALPVAVLWTRRRILALVVSAAFIVAGIAESVDYFRAQLQESAVYMENSMLETEAGRWLRSLDRNVPILAADRLRTHPTVRFLSGDHPGVAAAGGAVSEYLPLDATQSVAILSSFDEPSLFTRARSLYSQAPLQTFGPPLGQGQPLLFTMFVSKQLQEQTRGFQAETKNGAVILEPNTDSGDARAWSATMRVLTSGQYSVAANGSDVAIDDEPILSPGQPTANVFLARGAHSIHLIRSVDGPPTGLRVTLSSAAASAQGTPPPPGATDVLFFALPPPGGLLFTWQIEGQPPQALIDSAPHRGFEGNFNNGRPWTAQWRGQLQAAQSGDYAFRLEAITSATLFIDDRPIIAGGGEDHVTLGQGWHTFRVEYLDRDPYARLLLNWRPPGQTDFSVIPDEVLMPALAPP